MLTYRPAGEGQVPRQGRGCPLGGAADEGPQAGRAPAQLRGPHQGEALRLPALGSGLTSPMCPSDPAILAQAEVGVQRPSEKAEAGSFPCVLPVGHSPV